MTRLPSQIGAVSLATLMVLSVVVGSITFAGSVAAVGNATAVSQIDPLTVDEGTETEHTFNYSFSGINTSGNTTLTFSVPGEYPEIVDHIIVVKNGTGAELDATVTDDPRTLSFDVNSTTETVYFDGSVTLENPSVETDEDYILKFNGTDDDGDSASVDETLTVENVPGAFAIGSEEPFDPSTVEQDTENQHTFNYSIRGIDTSEETTFEINVPSELSIESSDVVVKNASGAELGSLTESGNTLSYSDTVSTESAYLAGSVNLTSPTVPEGEEEVTYNLTVEVSDPARSQSTDEELTVEYEGGQPGDPEFLSATQYEQGGTAYIEVAFSEDIQNFASNYGIYVDEEEVTGELNPTVNEAQGRVIIELDDTDSRDLTLRLEGGIEDTDGNALANPDSPEYKPITFAPTTVGAGESANVYSGSVVSIVADSSNTDITLQGTEDDTDGYFFEGSTGTNSRIFLFDTDGEEIGDYEADIGSEGTASITVRDLDLTLDIEDRNVTTLQTIDGTVSGQVGGREIQLELLDDNDEVVDERLVDLSGQGDRDFSYDVESLQLETGEYTVRATDTASGVSAESETITIREAGDTEALLPNDVVEEHRGDVVAIPIELRNTREATLTVGDDEAGYQASVTVRDDDGDDRDGEVTVYFNSYEAPNVGTGSFDGENDLFSVSDGDEVVDGEVTIGVSDLLDAEAYPLSVETEGRETDIQLLSLQERETTAIRTWTAPRNRYGDLDAAADVREGTDDEWLTRDSDIAVGDTVVYEIEASGLEGALDAHDQDTVTTEFFDFADGNRTQFTVEQQDPGPNQDPLLLDFGSSNARVVADSANDTYYVVAQTGEDDLEGVRDEDGDGVIDPGEDETGSVDADDSLRASFTVFGDDENDLDLTTGGEDETVETTHSLTDPEFEMTEPFNVTEVSGQEIFGEATVAPGTEVRVRVRSADGVRPAFLKSETTTVDADGQFLVTLSFNDTSPGDSYSITVDDIGPASELVVEGTVQPVIATPTTDTPTETTTTSTAQPTTTTATGTTAATTTTDIPTVQTPTTTPGFGVLAALVALAGAALLALRRE
ncbi:DUF7827 domain-containing protein [Halobellus captivus]|uniref:DUF7827 domain-containing protein n=1 Tax=Halobellus captivus TaxID=2592614 RepID=UPI0011A02BD2|nr:BGTF surface domain-containing protein [Halobellus captivus]